MFPIPMLPMANWNWELEMATLATLATFAAVAYCAEMQSDIVIYGSSPAAISAAVQAKRMDKSAVIVSPETRIGGLTTGGLGLTDIGNKAAFGGIALEFYCDVAKWYSYRPGGQSAVPKWTFEPSAALAILEGWEKRDGLDIRDNAWQLLIEKDRKAVR